MARLIFCLLVVHFLMELRRNIFLSVEVIMCIAVQLTLWFHPRHGKNSSFLSSTLICDVIDVRRTLQLELVRRRTFLAGSSHPSAHFQRWHPRYDPVGRFGDTYLYSRSKVRFILLSNLAPYRFLAHIMHAHCCQFFSPLGSAWISLPC